MILYKEATEMGHAESQCSLDYCFEKGLGVTLDYYQALEWYKKAAEQGYEDAKAALQRLNESSTPNE